MNYHEAMSYLSSAREFGVKLDLSRITELLNLLGNPQLSYKVIHIAGTNGKGSVSSYLAHISAAGGYKTGWYTSPYLENFNERLRIIDGRKGLASFKLNPRDPEISNKEFAELMTIIASKVDNMLSRNFDCPTEFELITAAALMWFAIKKCDMVILEVGLGGRLDSTNVVPNPICTVITSLGYDHCERLGYSLESIAFEKAGIIKQGVPCVVSNPFDSYLIQHDEAAKALAKIQSIAAAKHAPIDLVMNKEIQVLSYDQYGQSFHFRDPKLTYRISLLGDYQRMNAALAIQAAKMFTFDNVILEGLKMATWPGRLELLDGNPETLIDGAHNIQGCMSLAGCLEQFYHHRGLVFLVGVLKDKTHLAMMKAILKNHSYYPLAVICTKPPIPRGMRGKELSLEVASILGQIGRDQFGIKVDMAADINPNRKGITPSGRPQALIQSIEDIDLAADKAIKLARHFKAPLIAFGSLYLIGNVRETLVAGSAGQTQVIGKSQGLDESIQLDFKPEEIESKESIKPNVQVPPPKFRFDQGHTIEGAVNLAKLKPQDLPGNSSKED